MTPDDELTLQRAYHAWLVGRTALRARTVDEATATLDALDQEHEAVDGIGFATYSERSRS